MVGRGEREDGEHVLDVLAVGAGPSGSALGLLLAKAGFSVRLLEPGFPPQRSVGETLSARAMHALAALDLQQDFRRQHHAPAYARRSIWGDDVPREAYSITDPFGPSWHLDRTAFDAWLRAKAAQGGAPTIVGRPRRVSWDGGHWRVDYESSGCRYVQKARYLVDATGAGAWLSRRLGAQSICVHRLVGVARWFSSESAVDPVTLVEATEHGWWYSAPLPDGTLVAVWMTDATSVTARAGRVDESWRRCLEAGAFTHARVAGARPVAPAVTRSVGPAFRGWGDIPNWLPVGDAAVTFDPISGEGLEHALRSAIDAAAALVLTRSGETAAISAYREQVRREFLRHLLLREEAYRLERRFADAVFWRRAQGRELTQLP